jgi:hypothetical protein
LANGAGLVETGTADQQSGNGCHLDVPSYARDYNLISTVPVL